MENAPKTISRQEVTQNLLGGLLQDQEEFKNAHKLLKHGQKARLLDAMATYPTQDVEFSDSEPELRVAVTIWKRISDTLVAVGTEAAIEGILQGLVEEGKAEQEKFTKEVEEFGNKGESNE